MRIRFHTVAAIVVLIASGAWVATGKFSSVGSAVSGTDEASAAETPAPAAEEAPKPADVPQTVAYIVAKPSGYERLIHLAGQTEADKQVVLVAHTTGAIDKLPVSEGDHISVGGLIMELEGPEKIAALASAKAQLDSATHQAETNQKLFDRNTLPELQLEASIAAREAARSALEAAQAEVDRLEVHAPFTGIINQVFVEVGSWVQPGTEIASLLALDPIVVVGEVNERDLPAVPKGTRATVTFGNGTTAEGEVRYIRREASGLTRTFPIEVAISNPDAAIPAGMSAEIRLVADTAPAVILPRSVITLDPNGKLGVRTLADDNTVAFLAVTIVDDTPDGLVVAGVPEGTRIIVSGQDMVTDGQKVAAVQAAEDAAAQQENK